MDIGKIYDGNVADHYDDDHFGLISGARALGFRQILDQVPPSHVVDALDLAAGTGEALLAVRDHFPDSRLHGIDLSERMLEIAKQKLGFAAVRDDVVHAPDHYAPESMDLILMNFLTTYIDGAAVVRDTAKLLRPGGHYSIVSSTYGAFPLLRELCNRVIGKEAMDLLSPNPSGEALAAFLRGAGLEVLAADTFESEVVFSSFAELLDFGARSGFFSHIIAQADETQLATFRSFDIGYPLRDRYFATAVLGRKP